MSFPFSLASSARPCVPPSTCSVDNSARARALSSAWLAQPIFSVLSSSKSFSFCMLSSSHPSTCSAQLDHELPLQLSQLSSAMSSSFSMHSSTRPWDQPSTCVAQLNNSGHVEPNLHHDKLSVVMLSSTLCSTMQVIWILTWSSMHYVRT
jgi:hypothetical protein